MSGHRKSNRKQTNSVAVGNRRRTRNRDSETSRNSPVEEEHNQAPPQKRKTRGTATTARDAIHATRAKGLRKSRDEMNAKSTRSTCSTEVATSPQPPTAETPKFEREDTTLSSSSSGASRSSTEAPCNGKQRRMNSEPMEPAYQRYLRSLPKDDEFSGRKVEVDQSPMQRHSSRKMATTTETKQFNTSPVFLKPEIKKSPSKRNATKNSKFEVNVLPFRDEEFEKLRGIRSTEPEPTPFRDLGNTFQEWPLDKRYMQMFPRHSFNARPILTRGPDYRLWGADQTLQFLTEVLPDELMRIFVQYSFIGWELEKIRFPEICVPKYPGYPYWEAMGLNWVQMTEIRERLIQIEDANVTIFGKNPRNRVIENLEPTQAHVPQFVTEEILGQDGVPEAYDGEDPAQGEHQQFEQDMINVVEHEEEVQEEPFQADSEETKPIIDRPSSANRRVREASEELHNLRFQEGTITPREQTPQRFPKRGRTPIPPKRNEQKEEIRMPKGYTKSGLYMGDGYEEDDTSSIGSWIGITASGKYPDRPSSATLKAADKFKEVEDRHNKHWSEWNFVQTNAFFAEFLPRQIMIKWKADGNPPDGQDVLNIITNDRKGEYWNSMLGITSEEQIKEIKRKLREAERTFQNSMNFPPNAARAARAAARR